MTLRFIGATIFAFRYQQRRAPRRALGASGGAAARPRTWSRPLRFAS